MNTQPSFVIVGGGMAGAIAAQTLREEGFDGKITLLGQEPNAPYERPPLSKDYLQGKAERDSIFVHPEPWYAEHAVELSLGSAVTSLDPASRTVTTAAGERLSYDKLLLATGSKRRRLDRAGNRRRCPRRGAGCHAPRVRRSAARACPRPRGCGDL